MNLGTYIRVMKQVECPKCGAFHEATRSDAKCPECNEQRRRGKEAKYRVEHQEKIKADLAAWRKANPEKTKAHKSRHTKENRARLTAYENKRRAAKIQQMPAWADLEAINGMYELCGLFRRVGLDLHVDHITPLKGKMVSGLHVENNLQLLHKMENLRKKNTFNQENTCSI